MGLMSSSSKGQHSLSDTVQTGCSIDYRLLRHFCLAIKKRNKDALRLKSDMKIKFVSISHSITHAITFCRRMRNFHILDVVIIAAMASLLYPDVPSHYSISVIEQRLLAPLTFAPL
ncbi:unnamed protein product [Albugo candida]|uniref:Uncharacterized protein n=1 Tax=Albugo candida TaxID=65357 RepID=A0A024GTY1_9STRA|nr:unnamed protein product [Albugo candida]|eukprot:CCI49814.1 unnamed protein product [Albugo candida]